MDDVRDKIGFIFMHLFKKRNSKMLLQQNLNVQDVKIARQTKTCRGVQNTKLDLAKIKSSIIWLESVWGLDA